MSKNSSSRVVVWWFVLLAAALLALLVAWAARLIRVPTNTLLTVAVVVVALAWLLILAIKRSTQARSRTAADSASRRCPRPPMS